MAQWYSGRNTHQSHCHLGIDQYYNDIGEYCDLSIISIASLAVTAGSSVKLGTTHQYGKLVVLNALTPSAEKELPRLPEFSVLLGKI